MRACMSSTIQVNRANVDALDHAHVVQRHVNARVGHLFELAAVEAGHAERREPMAVGPIDGGQDIGLLPDPLIATSKSPGLPKFINCCTKIWS